MRAFIVFLSVILLSFSCKSKKKSAGSSKMTESFISSILLMDNQDEIQKMKLSGDPCRDPMNYVPDTNHLDHFPMKFIKINYQVIRSSEGKGNFSEQDGPRILKGITSRANDNLRTNQKMRMPADNDIPALPPRYKYVISPDPSIPGDDGIYFYNDDEYYFSIHKGKGKNNYDRTVIEKYAVQRGDVLNVIVQDVHLDSLKSKTYKPKSNGIAFSNWIKGGLWYYCMNYTKMKDGKKVYSKKYTPQKNLNHEIGHVFSLRHSWGRDGCDDTPVHANCWVATGEPPCLEQSNNMMDYNPHRSALTPCQIGNVLMTASRNNTKRKLLVKKWCVLKEDMKIVIDEPIEWNACKELEGHIDIRKGGKLTMRCKVALPESAIISVYPGGELILNGAEIYNDCGKKWAGIKVLAQNGVSGKVTYLNEVNLLNLENEINLSE